MSGRKDNLNIFINEVSVLVKKDWFDKMCDNGQARKWGKINKNFMFYQL